MCVPSLNEIHESVFELLSTQVIGMMEVKPVYPRLSSWDIMKYTQKSSGGLYALRYIINFFSYALPFKENLKYDKTPKFYVVQKLSFLFHVFTWDFKCPNQKDYYIISQWLI